MFVLPWQCLETFPLVRGNPKIPCMKEHKDENATGNRGIKIHCFCRRVREGEHVYMCKY